MSTIKVLHVIARMNVGGTARYVGELVKEIPQSALATGFVQGAEIEDHITSELRIYRIKHLGRRISIFNDFKAWLELSALVKDLQPEIIHTHTFKAGVIGRLIRGNHKNVHTFHGHLFGDKSFGYLEKRILIIVERFLARRTDLLISVGNRVGHELRAVGIGQNQIWTSISPGVSPLPEIDKTVARERLGLDPNHLLVGWMARMTGVKNPHLMLEVARYMPETKFVMAGGGDLLEDIKKLAPANVQVIGWTDASLFWSAVDIAVSSSDNEGMPVALIEAQLAGVPVVATDVGSSSEVVRDKVSGFIVKTSRTELVSAIRTLVNTPELLITFANSARMFSRDRFNHKLMTELHLSAYEKLT